MKKVNICESRIKDETCLLKDFFSKDTNISFAFIFGSFSKGIQSKYSDIDIAVYFKIPPYGLEILSLVNTLSDLIGRDVDIAVLNNASSFLKHQVMKYGSSLIIKDKLIYRQFREKTISDYDEYKFISGMNIYDR